MNIPDIVNAVAAGIDAQAASFQTQNLREFGRYANDERGWVDVSNLCPGLSYMTERYANQDGEGWLMRLRYTDGTDTANKVIDHGPGGFGSEWN